jgi:uncharacterized protein YndB with AHSA1/START domain
MRSFRYTTHIDRSPAHVWAFMMDFSKAPRWRNLVREVKILTDGPLRPGAELQITFDVQGRVRTARCEVWAFETARRFGLRNTEKNLTGTFEYTLAPEGTGTAVAFTCDIRPHGLMWLLLPLMIRGNRARYAQQLPNLKQAVEREG